MSNLVTWTAVADSTALAALPVPSDIQSGTKAYNIGVGAYFTYTISTASLVADSVVAVNGVTGARWILDATPSATAVTTSGATPTVTLAGTAADYLVVLGADVTTLTIAGLDLGAKLTYRSRGVIVGAAASVSLRLNNDNSHYSATQIQNSQAALSAVENETSAPLVVETPAADSLAPFNWEVAGPTGSAKYYRVEHRTLNANGHYYWETRLGDYTQTANVTSAVMTGAFKAGSWFTIHVGA